MFNSLTRLQNTFGLLTSVAGALALLVALSDLAAPRTPGAAVVEPTKLAVSKGRPHYYSSRREEYGSIRFSLEADLSSLFTWNTKELFVYVTAEWPEAGEQQGSEEEGGKTTRNGTATNVAVIWDQIITSPSADYLSKLGPIARKNLKKRSEGKKVDPSRGLIQLRDTKPKYQITHPSGRIANVDNVRLRLHYNVQPWVGVLTWNQDRNFGLWRGMVGGVSKEAFKLPAVKTAG